LLSLNLELISYALTVLRYNTQPNEPVKTLKTRLILLVPRTTTPVRGLVVAKAFVLINAEVGSEDQIVTDLRKITNVKEAYAAYGAYDIVAKIEAESMDKLKDVVNGKIRRLEKVRSTLTMIIVEGS
jgi:DNA-binding Lrp family transcriptional regulator